MRLARLSGKHSGFTYLTVLFVVAFMGLGLAVTGESWRTAATRAKEAELLYVGNQYRRAIEKFYMHGAMRYPSKLEDLLKDPRYPDTRRYLRQLYRDPVTGSAEWGLVKAPDGGVMGVFSRSEDKPLKTAGFAPDDKLFEQSQAYSDWKFVFTPGGPQLPVAPVPANASPGSPPPSPQAGGSPAARGSDEGPSMPRRQ